MASVALFRAPLGRPLGLPLCPGRKGVNCFGAVFSLAASITRAPSARSLGPGLAARAGSCREMFLSFYSALLRHVCLMCAPKFTANNVRCEKDTR
jgi:hypothetical protein